MGKTSVDRARRTALAASLIGAIVFAIGYGAYAALFRLLHYMAFSAIFVLLPTLLWLIAIAVVATRSHDLESRSGRFGLGLVVMARRRRGGM